MTAIGDPDRGRIEATLAGFGLEVVQLAFHVPDPERAARGLASERGWGPFYLLENIPLASAVHRGVPATFDHTSAYGQGDGLMIELITQHGDEPSVLRELFAADRSGLHHVAVFVDDLEAGIDLLARDAGWGEAFRAETRDGVTFVMVDARADLGCFVELYEPGIALERFYAHVARSARDWDGARPVRRIEL